MIKNAKMTIELINKCLENGYLTRDIIEFFEGMSKRKTAYRYRVLVADIINDEVKEAKQYAENFKVSYQQISNDYEYCFRFLRFMNNFKVQHGIKYNRELHQGMTVNSRSVMA